MRSQEMSVSNLAAFSISGIKIGNADATTDIHVEENGVPSRIVGEIVLENLDPNQTYTFSVMTPEDPTQELLYNFQVVPGTGADADKYFLALADGVTFDFEGPNAHSFVLKVTDGNNDSVLKQIDVTVDDVNETPTFVGVAVGSNAPD